MKQFHSMHAWTEYTSGDGVRVEFWSYRTRMLSLEYNGGSSAMLLVYHGYISRTTTRQVRRFLRELDVDPYLYPPRHMRGTVEVFPVDITDELLNKLKQY